MDLDARLDEIERRYVDLGARMGDPAVTADPDQIRRIGKDLSELEEIVVPYREYRAARREAEETRTLADEERDGEMAAFLKQEAAAAERRVTELRARLEELLVPRDPNDAKDVVVEIRAGAGGQEAALGRASSSSSTGSTPSADGGRPTCSPRRRRTSAGSRRSSSRSAARGRSRG